MYYEIKFSCYSHIGKKRKINQDNYSCCGQYMLLGENIHFPLTGSVNSKKASLFGIFDGMGGEERGEEAALIAAKVASSMKFSKKSVEDLTEYCKMANEEICNFAKDNSISSMGTTAAVLLCSKKNITLCNIGDSKIFRLSGGKIKQISKDHVVNVFFGMKPPLSQNLGIPVDEMTIEPYISRGEYKDGDKYLICSDGLTDMVDTNEICEVLEKNSLEKSCKALIEKALENGGRDNITVLILEIKGRSFVKELLIRGGNK